MSSSSSCQAHLSLSLFGFMHVIWIHLVWTRRQSCSGSEHVSSTSKIQYHHNLFLSIGPCSSWSLTLFLSLDPTPYTCWGNGDHHGLSIFLSSNHNDHVDERTYLCIIPQLPLLKHSPTSSTSHIQKKTRNIQQLNTYLNCYPFSWVMRVVQWVRRDEWWLGGIVLISLGHGGRKSKLHNASFVYSWFLTPTLNVSLCDSATPPPPTPPIHTIPIKVCGSDSCYARRRFLCVIKQIHDERAARQTEVTSHSYSPQVTPPHHLTAAYPNTWINWLFLIHYARGLMCYE